MASVIHVSYSIRWRKYCVYTPKVDCLVAFTARFRPRDSSRHPPLVNSRHIAANLAGPSLTIMQHYRTHVTKNPRQRRHRHFDIGADVATWTRDIDGIGDIPPCHDIGMRPFADVADMPMEPMSPNRCSRSVSMSADPALILAYRRLLALPSLTSQLKPVYAYQDSRCIRWRRSVLLEAALAVNPPLDATEPSPHDPCRARVMSQTYA